MDTEDFSGNTWTPKENQTPETEGFTEEDSQSKEWHNTVNEKDYLKTKDSFTQTRQSFLNFCETQVDKDPNSIYDIKDSSVQKKILQKKFSVDTIEELEEIKAINPELFWEEAPQEVIEESGEDRQRKMEKELERLIYREKKEKEKQAIKMVMDNNPNITSQVDWFEDKMREEMKNFSDTLTIEQKAEKALWLLSLWVTKNISTEEWYKVLIWEQWVSSNNPNIVEWWNPMTDEEFKKTDFYKALEG